MENQKEEAKFIQMTQQPLEPLICKLAVPTMISMLITNVYNMADTFWIGKIGTSASGAVGVAFSMMALIQALGFFFGQGAGNNISRAMGSHQQERANQLAAVGFYSSIFCGLVVTVLGLCFLEPLTYLLGATDTIYPYAVDYLRLILIGAPWMMASFVLNNLLRFQGNAFYGMIGLTIGGIVNMALDPILIFNLHMGIAGAALATIFSQAISFCILFWQCNHMGMGKVRLRFFRFSWSIYGDILRGGLPSLLRQGIASVATICLNTVAKPFGDATIAAMTIVNRITMLSNSTMIGFGQGFQPVCGFNYGAKLYERVRRGFFFCVKVTAAALLILAAVEFAIAPQLVELFRKADPEVTAIGAVALRWQCVTLILSCWIIPSNMMLQTTGKVVGASLIGLARHGIFLIPLVFLLPGQLGIFGIQIAQPIADVLSCALAIPLTVHFLRGMRKREDLDKNSQSA